MEEVEGTGSPEISKSWVIVDNDSAITGVGGAERVEDIGDNQRDSDTDISIISETCNSCASEDEDQVQPILPCEKEEEKLGDEATDSRIPDEEPDSSEINEEYEFSFIKTVITGPADNSFILLSANIAIGIVGVLLGVFLTSQSYTRYVYVPEENTISRGFECKDRCTADDISKFAIYDNLHFGKKVSDSDKGDYDAGSTQPPVTDDDRKKLDELRALEEYLNEKEKFLIKKEHELLHKQMKIKKRKSDLSHCDNRDNQRKRETVVRNEHIPNVQEGVHNLYKNRKYKGEVDIDQQHENKRRKPRDTSKSKNKNFKRKSDFNLLELNIDDIISDKNSNKKTSSDAVQFKSNKLNFESDENQNVRSQSVRGEPKERHNNKGEIVHKVRAKKSKTPKRNITGKWYQNMHDSRQNLRKKEHTSDWLFERAHLRSVLRNKAHWYFQWMSERENRRIEK